MSCMQSCLHSFPSGKCEPGKLGADEGSEAAAQTEIMLIHEKI